MQFRKIVLVILLSGLFSCKSNTNQKNMLGSFNIGQDLFLAQFDCKTDTDDIHSVAGVATMLKDRRFANVDYHAVAGAYGIQEGLYVPANEVFQLAFGKHWSDAHSDYEQALNEVSGIVINTLELGGDIWIADAGQSDFSASVIKNVKSRLPALDTKIHIHIIQHSEWNENSTAPENLSYVKANSDYNKIPDGNVIDNGTPGFYTEEEVNWQQFITNTQLAELWNKAIETAHKYNGQEGRHNNPAIASGGMDFSDVSETCWIFGFGHIKNAEEFFIEFGEE
ncbi:MAG: hypothetical protein JW995_04280 [Melioribacteraceae bacterium]|nr:hypothetical protein [Melioribacteraceae bacterium]